MMSVKSAGVLNTLFEFYKKDPSETNLDALVAEISRYAKRILLRTGFTNRLGDLDEVVQAATIKVWQNLPKFHGKSKFSSWAHRIIKNAALDEVRTIGRRHEIHFPESEDGEVNHDALEKLLFYGDARKPQSHCYRGPTGQEDYDGHGNEGGVGNRTHILSKPPDRAADADERSYQGSLLDFVLDSSCPVRVLPEDYRVVLVLFRMGRKPKEIAKILGMKPKQVSNQLNAAKKILKKLLSKSETANVIEVEDKKPFPASQAAD